MEKEFKRMYAKLNKEQRRAVDAIEGPVMVIAGPGTGKTQILTLRIANILYKTDTKPQNILALTFTESAAYSMRKRLVEIVGSSGYRVNIQTFHGFCNEIIEKFPEAFPRILGSRNITESEQIRIVERILAKSDFKKIKSYADPSFHVRAILDAVRTLKREDIDPETFKKLVRRDKEIFKKIPDIYHEKGAFKGEMRGKYRELQKTIEKNTELCDLYHGYEEELRKLKKIDFEDMIMEVIRRLEEDKDLLLILQEEYQYILADEHQDANASQNRLLELLSSFHENPNVFIVGDEKQAIFRFQGASLQNFLFFKRKYKKALLIELRENYRSPQFILDSAHSLISTGRKKEDIPILLRSNKPSKEQAIKLLVFSNPEYEEEFIAHSIRKKLEHGVSPSSIAVLYRDNKDVLPIARSLEREGIPFAIESNQDLLGDVDVRKFLLILETIDRFGDEEMLASFLHIDFLHILPSDIFALLEYSRKQKKPLGRVLFSKDDIEKASLQNSESVQNAAKMLLQLTTASRNLFLLDFFEEAVRESGFLEHLLALPSFKDKMNKLDNLFDEVKKVTEARRDAKLTNFIEYLEVLRNYNILLSVREKQGNVEGVRLMTAHRAKGQEFDHVYLMRANDKHWGNRRGRSSFRLPLPGVPLSASSEEDERRLFYVALTRAKREIFITYSEMGESGERLLPSQFVEEIDKKYIEIIKTKEIEKDLEKKLVRFNKQSISSKNRSLAEDREYLRELFLKDGLSVTALNNYLECPWKYFFRNLMRIPEKKEKQALYGTAIHAALSLFFAKYRINEDLSKKEFLLLFRNNLEKMPLSMAEFKEAKERGEKSLRGYYDTYKGTWNRNLFTEYKIMNPFEVKDKDHSFTILLRGTLDKVEFLEGKNVRVVDYKTSKPKSRNEIMGETKEATGNFYRQLVFYKLLVEKSQKENWCMEEGMIDFIEPGEKGNYKRELFTIEKEELKTLEELIGKIAGEIYNLAFLEVSCKDKTCKYCRLRDLMHS